MIEVKKEKIKCPIFSNREELIQKLSCDIWREDLTSGEILSRARQLFTEADSLFHCPKYNSARFECKICQAVSELRKKTSTNLLASWQGFRRNQQGP